jgi:hypothetical protein
MEASSPGQPGGDVERAQAAADEPDPTQASTPDEVAEPEGGPDSPPREQSPLGAQAAAAEPDPFAERPELYVAGAFAGGLALAMLLRALGPSE